MQFNFELMTATSTRSAQVGLKGKRAMAMVAPAAVEADDEEMEMRAWVRWMRHVLLYRVVLFV
jgi:hypothetical protein